MLTLHFSPGSIAVVVAIALEEAGLEYEAVDVGFASGGQRSDAYLALNPKGRVPTLETDQGLLTETGAILEWIGATAAPGLVPDDPFAAAKMRECMFYLASTMHVAHAHKLRGARWADQDASLRDMTAKVPETMTACCAHLEDTVPFAPFAMGEALTLADPYLFVITGWAPGDGVDLAAFPRLLAWYNKMSDRPSVQRVRTRGILP